MRYKNRNIGIQFLINISNIKRKIKAEPKKEVSVIGMLFRTSLLTTDLEGAPPPGTPDKPIKPKKDDLPDLLDLESSDDEDDDSSDPDLQLESDDDDSEDSVPDLKLESESEEEEEEEKKVKVKAVKRRLERNVFGEIAGNSAFFISNSLTDCPIGTAWERRVDCARDGVHRFVSVQCSTYHSGHGWLAYTDLNRKAATRLLCLVVTQKM
jgi:hypothetical protein